MQKMGITLIIYLDDILIMSETKELAQAHTTVTVNLLSSLGFVIKEENSVFEAHQRIIIPRFSGKLNYNVPIPPKRKDKGYQEGLLTNLRQSDSVGQSSASPSGKAFILNSSSFSRSPSLSFLAEGQECGFKENPELRIYPISRSGCSTRVALVEGPSCSLEWQVPSKEE